MVVTVPFKTIMVAKIIVVKYIKLKEKEKKTLTRKRDGGCECAEKL